MWHTFINQFLLFKRKDGVEAVLILYRLFFKSTVIKTGGLSFMKLGYYTVSILFAVIL